MRISELSRLSGVPNATIKYYLREGLLPAGRATGATQAEYDESHLKRLRLIRALIGVRGLSVAATKQLLDTLAEGHTDTHHVLGLVFGIWPSDTVKPEKADGEKPAGAGQKAGPVAGPEIGPKAGPEASAEAAPEDGPKTGTEAGALVDAMGWTVSDYNPARQIIDQTVRTLRSLGMDYDWRSLLPYARLAEETARHDLDQLQLFTDPLEKAERAVLLTFLLEPALMALRRLAQEDESIVRYGDGTAPATAQPGPVPAADHE
ncbi:MerR family transcriptional regulator [Streptomyces paludis]|uniref:MerR family transcriptional regulator n=1 Tax=Streptomyces paludis TaxID=2282738 RepID=UPI0015F2CC64|nr:MerR family transcriptional regulator [Streptomyces paludis]